MRRGDVVVVALPGDLGKPRPAVVVQANVLNDSLRTILLCPISSFSSQPSFFRVAVEPTTENGLRLPSEIMVDKLQSTNRTRIAQVIGRVDDATQQKLSRSIMLALALTNG